MFLVKYTVYCVILWSIKASPQINLYLTEWTNNQTEDQVVQHNCLHVAASMDSNNNSPQIISYCLSEWPSKWHIHKNSLDRVFTFLELFNKHITSEQLHLWSVPIDIIECYQLYINQRLYSSNTTLAKQIIYNCTWPRFGSLCQYEFPYYDIYATSMSEMIHEYYRVNRYQPTTLTCYVHLDCYRGPGPSCLDWSEICDGKIDCLNNGQDEKYCWLLEMNECLDDEFRCINGQCIPNRFFRDNPNTPDCLDGSDEVMKFHDKRHKCESDEPTFTCEDVTCKVGHQYTRAPLTSSCVKQRNNLLLQAMFYDKPTSINDSCWLAFKCMANIVGTDISICSKLCTSKTCEDIIPKLCPDTFYFPSTPVLFGHVYFIYTKAIEKDNLSYSNFIKSVCYNSHLCDESITNQTITCQSLNDLFLNSFDIDKEAWLLNYIIHIYWSFLRCRSMNENYLLFCDKSIMYQCMNSSKCISQHRLLDKVNDCYHKDDENPHLIADSLVYNQLQKYFKCTTTNEYIPQYLVQDGICDCKKYDSNTFCDDEDQHIIYTRNHISFQTICDGFTELLPVMIDGQIETDETNCQQWLCNNTYTRCDGFWNCFDGADEINCDTLPSLVCPLQNHICVSPVTNQMMCLPISKANDGKIDCLGGTDEPKFCRNSNHTLHDRNFYCRNDTYSSCIQRKDLCDTHRNCLHGDDEQFCQNRNNTRFHICDETDALVSTYVENFFCQRRPDTVKRSIVHFALGQVHESNKYRNNLNQILITERTINKKLRCHRGLDLRVWLNKDKNISTMTCLCPPSFYGNMCQYQNQRVSLTIQFSAKSNSRRKPFVIVISLIDDSEERIIHSSRQISYLPMRDCENKFNIYLLYANRPKDHRKLYFIHIDIYEHVSLTYRGSFLFPITFSFLPVQRLTIQVTIPGSNIKRKTYSDNNPCVHGRLIQYINELNILSFCQCYPGWIGRYCSISYPCMCSTDSICSGILANNRSLCICPINKFGSLCLLNNNICQFNNNTQCRNGGQCIPISVDMESQKPFTCICTKGFTGERCEIQDTKIILSFHKQIVLSESMFVHFIQINHDAAPERSTTFRVLGENHDFVTIYWSHPFHLVFVELPEKKYYLTVIKKFYQQSVIIRKTLDSSDRCPHIRELLDKTIVQSHLLRRIKYYHLPCKNHAYHLSCFYDDIHLCVCQNYSQQRIANCFEFNHYMKLDCFGESSCENGAQCFQDNRYCPQTSTCVCSKCFYGTRCQFTMDGFGWSLDGILGYHILPHVRLTNQSLIVRISVALTIIMTLFGIINSTLSIITFKNKKPRQVGCGCYLLGSSIASFLTMCFFAIKCWILITAQISMMNNRSLLYVQCVILDFLLRVCLNMDQWLSACVAIERAITATIGVQFNAARSKRIARFVIPGLLFLMIVTTIHDPFYRRLIKEDYGDEKRIWCASKYSSHWQTFNSTINIFHFFAPFLINLISALLIIKTTARQRGTIRTHRYSLEILHNQFRKHRHLLIAPILLVILALPRVLISLVAGCMKSTRQSWLYLIGYFISFIPPLLTFILFILPSKVYKKEFQQSINQYRRRFMNRVRPMLL